MKDALISAMQHDSYLPGVGTKHADLPLCTRPNRKCVCKLPVCKLPEHDHALEHAKAAQLLVSCKVALLQQKN